MKAYMGLSCKVEAYGEVLDKLLDLNLTKSDIYLLFGRLNILVQFRELKSLDEFIQKWFNPIMMTIGDGSLVEKPLTLIGVSEGPSYVEEPFAFMFLNTPRKNLENVQQALLNLPQVLSADTVFGPYDIICAVRAKDASNLEEFISKMQDEATGVQNLMTATVSSLY